MPLFLPKPLEPLTQQIIIKSSNFWNPLTPHTKADITAYRSPPNETSLSILPTPQDIMLKPLNPVSHMTRNSKKRQKKNT